VEKERYSPSLLQHQCLKRLREVQAMLENLEPGSEEQLRVALRPAILTLEEAEQFLRLINKERVRLERAYGFLGDSRRIIIDDENSLRTLIARLDESGKTFAKNPVSILVYAFGQYCLAHNEYLASLAKPGLHIKKQEMGIGD